jgi:hypothetical protein
MSTAHTSVPTQAAIPTPMVTVSIVESRWRGLASTLTVI